MNASGKPSDGDASIGLAEAIAVLRDELLKARAAAAGSDIQLPVESMTSENGHVPSGGMSSAGADLIKSILGGLH